MKNNIKQLRKAANLSQAELGRRSNSSRQTINALENQKYAPRLQLAFDIATVLDTTVDELFIHKK